MTPINHDRITACNSAQMAAGDRHLGAESGFFKKSGNARHGDPDLGKKKYYV